MFAMCSKPSESALTKLLGGKSGEIKEKLIVVLSPAFSSFLQLPEPQGFGVPNRDRVDPAGER